MITNISGLEHAGTVDKDWKTRSIGYSLTVVALLTVVFSLACLEEVLPAKFNRRNLLASAGILALASLGLSYAVWDRLVADRGQDHGA